MNTPPPPRTFFSITQSRFKRLIKKKQTKPKPKPNRKARRSKGVGRRNVSAVIENTPSSQSTKINKLLPDPIFTAAEACYVYQVYVQEVERCVGVLMCARALVFDGVNTRQCTTALTHSADPGLSHFHRTPCPLHEYSALRTTLPNTATAASIAAIDLHTLTCGCSPATCERRKCGPGMLNGSNRTPLLPPALLPPTLLANPASACVHSPSVTRLRSETKRGRE